MIMHNKLTPRLHWIGLIGLVLATLALMPMNASAISFVTPSGSMAGGEAVSAEADLSLSGGVLTVVLSNTLGASVIKDAGQTVSDLLIMTNQTLGTPSATQSGQLGNVASQVVTYTSGSPAWGVSNSTTSTLFLNGLSGPPKDTHIILPFQTNGGSYPNSNGSITDNNGHNPFTIGSITFMISGTGLTTLSQITGVTFSFGTSSGVDVPGVITPEPASVILFSLCGVGVAAYGALARKRKAA